MIGFVRKEDFFIKLYKLVSSQNDDTIFLKQIRRMAISNNLNQFSNLLQNCNENEKECIINNQSKIKGYIKQGRFRKGESLLDLVVQSWIETKELKEQETLRQQRQGQHQRLKIELEKYKETEKEKETEMKKTDDEPKKQEMQRKDNKENKEKDTIEREKSLKVVNQQTNDNETKKIGTDNDIQSNPLVNESCKVEQEN